MLHSINMKNVTMGIPMALLLCSMPVSAQVPDGSPAPTLLTAVWVSRTKVPLDLKAIAPSNRFVQVSDLLVGADEPSESVVQRLRITFGPRRLLIICHGLTFREVDDIAASKLRSWEVAHLPLGRENLQSNEPCILCEKVTRDATSICRYYSGTSNAAAALCEAVVIWGRFKCQKENHCARSWFVPTPGDEF